MELNDEHMRFPAIEKVLDVLRVRLNIALMDGRPIELHRDDHIFDHDHDTQKSSVYYRNIGKITERRLAMMHHPANASDDFLQLKTNHLAKESRFAEFVSKYKRYCDKNDTVTCSTTFGRQLTLSHISFQLESLYSGRRWYCQFSRFSNVRCVERLGKVRLAERHDKWIVKRKCFGQWLQYLQKCTGCGDYTEEPTVLQL